MDIFEGGKEFFARGLFQHIAAGAGGQGVEEVVGVLIDGEHDELGLGKERFEMPDAFGTGHCHQVNVHQDDIGPFLREAGQGGFGAAEGAYKAQFGRVSQPLGKDLPHGGIIFNNRHTNTHSGQSFTPFPVPVAS